MESHLKIHISSLIWNEGKISLWIVANKLLLNLAKTEFLSTGSGQRLFNLIWESHKKINEIPCLYYEIFRCTYSWKLNGNFPIQYIKKKNLKKYIASGIDAISSNLFSNIFCSLQEVFHLL